MRGGSFRVFGGLVGTRVWARYGSGYRLFNKAALAGAALLAAMMLAPPIATAAPLRLLMFGDSLFSGYGLANPNDGVAAQLQAALKAAGYDVAVTNGGVAGDTTTDGLARLDWTLGGPQGFQVAIVCLGANDGLRGIDPSVTKANLDRILAGFQARHIPVMLAGMMAPPNLGQDYARRFDTIYPDLAKAHHVPLYPFYLDGVAAVPALNQADGIHPNSKGVALIVKRMLPTVEHWLDGLGRRTG